MNPVGYGESRPIDTNASEPGRENNRRVELKVLE
jgi:OOP family OmpA-OmpF porin